MASTSKTAFDVPLESTAQKDSLLLTVTALLVIIVHLEPNQIPR